MTAAGQAEFAKINERSQEEIGAMLSTVPEADQQRLVDAHHSFGHDLVGETWELDL